MPLIEQIEKPFLVVTGMHRSGTSFLARALNLCGVYLGEPDNLTSTEWRPFSDNLRGHWEHKELWHLAKRTLEKQSILTWPPRDPKDIVVDEKTGEEIQRCVGMLMDHPSLAAGFKHPYNVLCFESWLKYLPKNVVLVAIFRHPVKVAESLRVRDGSDLSASINWWKFYNETLLSLLDKHNGFLLNFDWSKERLISETKMIAHKLGLIEADLSEWYAEELLHSNKAIKSDHDLPYDVTRLYSMLVERSEKNNLVEVNKVKYSSEELIEILKAFMRETQIKDRHFAELYMNLIRKRGPQEYKTVLRFNRFINKHFPRRSKRRRVIKVVLRPISLWLERKVEPNDLKVYKAARQKQRKF